MIILRRESNSKRECNCAKGRENKDGVMMRIECIATKLAPGYWTDVALLFPGNLNPLTFPITIHASLVYNINIYGFAVKLVTSEYFGWGKGKVVRITEQKTSGWSLDIWFGPHLDSLYLSNVV